MDSKLVLQFFNEDVPFHHLIGLKVTSAADGKARSFLAYRPDFIGDASRPALHGGVLATLVDVCGGAAVMSAIGPRDRISTIDFRVDFLRPGQPLDIFCDALVTRIGARVAVASAVVHHGDPAQPVAEGKCVYDIRRNRTPPADE